MKVSYLVEITNPESHFVKVRVSYKKPKDTDIFEVFLPSWSPGSYLMREYARHVRLFRCQQANGEVLFSEQVKKGEWKIDWSCSQLNSPQDEFEIEYEVYCHELTVRTSHIDASHAFLHGPSYLIGLKGALELEHEVEFRFPPIWTHLSTGLKMKEGKREEFLYEAKNYDELVDTPVEIGCHETDGFMHLNKEHHLAFYGEQFSHENNLKADVKKVVEFVSSLWGKELPYEKYQFITHLAPGLGGGLEHHNSTALHFDGRKLNCRKDYLTYLSLVSHEYFHTWNIKRIRPKELGPFDYQEENYTTMLWLAEGLTSFVDDLIVYRAQLCTLEEYLGFVKGHLERYYTNPGRKFHSLEQSSFNAWIKLYRPDENSKNSSISYYLKGGLVFTLLHARLLKAGSHTDELLKLLWKRYQDDPAAGMTKDEVYQLIEQLAGKEVKEEFSEWVETTKELPLEEAFNAMGVAFEWESYSGSYLGINFKFKGERCFVGSIDLDSPAYKCGLNAGDEILFINGQRILKPDVERLPFYLSESKEYEIAVSRLNQLQQVLVIPGKGPKLLKELKVFDQKLAEQSFK